MTIKALVFDLDGTAIPQKLDAMPSKAVIDAVKKAKKYCHVSIATGRPLNLTRDILTALGINDLCILSGGAALYSCKTNAYVWKQEMDPKLLQEVFFKLKRFGDHFIEDDRQQGRVRVSEYHPDGQICLSCIFAVTQAEAQEITAIVAESSGVVAHAMNSWTPGFFDVHITHELATKKHALGALIARLGVDHAQVMVVGDGGNDLPLFELAGVKVAMGNASDVLKAKADWIAPSVHQDGLAAAIEKYILL